MSNFSKGWDTDSSNQPKMTRMPNSFFISVNDKTPEADKEVQVIVLDDSPVQINRHHYFDPRLIDPKGTKGKWGNFFTCVTGNPAYVYCPACRAERKFSNKLRSHMKSLSYLTVFSLREWKDDKGVAHISGRALFPMSSDTKVTLGRIISKQREKAEKDKKTFSVVGAKFNCFRASAQKETVGNDFEYLGQQDMQKMAESYGVDNTKPFNYSDIFAPASFEEMVEDYNVLCSYQRLASNFFDIPGVKTRSDSFSQSDPSSDTYEDEIPF